MKNIILTIGRNRFYPYISLVLITLAYLYTNPINAFDWRYFASYFGAMTGLICVILLAKRHYFGNYLGLLAAFGESSGNFLGGNIGAGLPHLYFFSTHVYALINWRSHQDEEHKVITRALKPVHYLYILIGFSLAFAFNIYLTHTTTVENSFAQLVLNSGIFGIGVIAQTLLMGRFQASWYFWISMNVLVIGLNIYTNNPVIATQYCIYLLNSVYGLLEWKISSDSENMTLTDKS